MVSSEIGSSVPEPIPLAPKAIPLLGHALPLMRDPLGFLNVIGASGTPVVRMRLGPFRAVMVCDPELTQQVLRDDHTFDKGGPLYNGIRSAAGNNLISCPHDQHRRQRRLIQPSFQHTRFAGYAPAMTTQIHGVIDRWRGGQTIDVLTEMTELTTSTVTATMFSDTLEPSVLRQALDDLEVIVDGISRRMVVPAAFDRVPTPGNRRYHRARTRLRALTDDIVAKRRADGTDHSDLLSTLMTARDTDDADNRGLSDSEIYDQLIAFFLAGSETTASALAWSLHLLAQHPEIEERLHDEVDRVLTDGTAHFDDLSELTLTEHVITEALRLYPPAWLLTRTVTTDTHLGGFALPRGTTVTYSPYLIHHRADLYQHPERFDPDRWADTTLRRDAFIPFGGGARQCMGKTFGRIEATLALATITANWRLDSLPDHEVRPAAGAALHPRNLRMQLTARGDGRRPPR